ncbi:hypothetical protein NHX12_031023, partial [Muraenolepis orangiensis]
PVTHLPLQNRAVTELLRSWNPGPSIIQLNTAHGIRPARASWRYVELTCNIPQKEKQSVGQVLRCRTPQGASLGPPQAAQPRGPLVAPRAPLVAPRAQGPPQAAQPRGLLRLPSPGAPLVALRARGLLRLPSPGAPSWLPGPRGPLVALRAQGPPRGSQGPLVAPRAQGPPQAAQPRGPLVAPQPRGPLVAPRAQGPPQAAQPRGLLRLPSGPHATAATAWLSLNA